MDTEATEITEVIIRRRLESMPTLEDFEVRTTTVPATVASGQVRIRTSHIGLNPGLRSRFRDADAPVGKPAQTQAVGQILQSTDPDFPVGSWVHGRWPWATLVDVDPSELSLLGAGSDPVDPALEIGPLGWSGQTAYVGVTKYAKPAPGEVMYISSGAGSVGSVAGQLAKRAGAFVIGSAGSEEKLEIMREMGFDAVFNYKTEPPAVALPKLAPQGLDIYYDNVGGDHLQAAFENMAMHGRIVCCGSVAGYNAPDSESTLAGLRRIVTSRLSIRGFVLWDHDAHKAEHRADLQHLFTQGGFIFESKIFAGIENIPQAFISMLEGGHRGQTIVAFEPGK